MGRTADVGIGVGLFPLRWFETLGMGFLHPCVVRDVGESLPSIRVAVVVAIAADKRVSGGIEKRKKGENEP